MLPAEPLRRAFRRYVRLDCQVVREHDFRLVGDLALDLSTKGMLVRARRPVLTGEEVIVAFKPTHRNRWFDALATVARVVHGRRPGDAGHCLGLAFHGMAAGDEAHLFDALRGLEPPTPSRPLRPLTP